MHLSSDELIDLAEGTRTEASAPHLGSCDVCRRQLADLRAMMSAAAQVEVPEPSPLFWERFSARVHQAVAVESARGWNWSWARFRMPIAAAVATAVLVIAVSSARLLAPHRPAVPQPPATAFGAPVAAPATARDTLADGSDPSFRLVADLTENMDWEVAREAGLTAGGSAEHAVTHLSAAELRELQRLLQEELARPGA